MNKVHCTILLVVLMVFAVSVLPIEGVPTGGCPSDALCAKYCKSNKYGSTGKCDNTNCKCSVG
uniref:Putative K+ channel toxin n=1 Tax=Superstitionia donensis TaxID=311983 RepID=A0A1V1WBQ4_9SCOR